MTVPILDPAVVESLRRLNQPGEPDVVQEVLTLFIAEAPARLAAVAAAVDAADAMGLQRAAHALKGSAAAIGATALQRICGDLEEMARHGALAGASEGAESMRSAYTSLHAEIDHLLGRPS
jgi:HPt (histidine-containing phosphotransfer) domain-containing protein